HGHVLNGYRLTTACSPLAVSGRSLLVRDRPFRDIHQRSAGASGDRSASRRGLRPLGAPRSAPTLGVDRDRRSSLSTVGSDGAAPAAPIVALRAAMRIAILPTVSCC